MSEREKQRAEEELKLKVIDYQNILRQKVGPCSYKCWVTMCHGVRVYTLQEELLKTCEREKEELTKAQQELIKKVFS